MKARSGDLMKKGDGAMSPRLIIDGEPPNPIAWPDPTPEMLASPAFEAIWQCIKKWDINVPSAYAGYCGATGNHARAILDALHGIPEVAGIVGPSEYVKAFQRNCPNIQLTADEREELWRLFSIATPNGRM